MTNAQLGKLIDDVISTTVANNQETVNSEISKDIFDAYNDNEKLSFQELIHTLSNAYMNSAVELSVKSVMDILVKLNIINLNS